MEILYFVLIILGLSLFETISSIDNAIINAEILSNMSFRARRWFLTWGLLIAVFMVRGLLPWFIIWFSTPNIGPIEAFFATFSKDPSIKKAIEKASPVLLIGGGTFLVFLFLHWIFMEPKNYGFSIERFFERRNVWFYATVSVFLSVLVWFALEHNPKMAFGAVVGSTAFFIVSGFKENASRSERELKDKKMSDISKILYLEVIDATFSIDGVLGAFAFTLSVPLILLGNGLGAFIVRELSIRNIENVKRYKYLKNGAMYSIFALGIVMICESYKIEVPPWFSPMITFLIIGYFFLRSRRELKAQ